MISSSIAKNKEAPFSWKKISKSFTKFTAVGIIATFCNIYLLWLLIDIYKINTLISSSVVVLGIFLAKFIAYHKINLIRKQFIKYTVIQVSMRLLQIFGVWYLIDILEISTLYSAVIVMGAVFMLTFIIFKITGLIIE